MGDMEDDDPECTAVASRAELNAAIAAAAKGKKKQRTRVNAEF